MITSVTSRSTAAVDRTVAVGRQVDRVADRQRVPRPRDEPDLLAVQVDLLLHAPLRHRDHRDVRREQRQPGGAGLAGHRPAVRVAGHRAFGCSTITPPPPARDRGANDCPRRPCRASPGCGPCAHRGADREDVEDRVLGEEARRARAVDDHLGDQERIDVRDVVDDDDRAALLGQLLEVAVPRADEQRERGVEDQRSRSDQTRPELLAVPRSAQLLQSAPHPLRRASSCAVCQPPLMRCSSPAWTRCAPSPAVLVTA